MASLDFKGKQFVATHHYSVPFRELTVDPKKSLPPKGQAPALDDNLIIHGDNLEALKALLPRYAGKIKCIYIDPPYNTGNEGWAYNDNLRAPFIKEWLGKTVGSDDLERHDKWLCMMMPRLILLRELLAEDGVIFVSIDDNEQHHLRNLMDEIFDENNFISEIVWFSKYTVANDTKYLSQQHEYVIAYAKCRENLPPLRLPRTKEMDDRYTNPDGDPRGPWKPKPLHAKSGSGESYKFTFRNGVTWSAPMGAYPRFSIATLRKLDDDNRISFGRNGDATPSVKTFLSELPNERVAGDHWHFDDVGHTHFANEELASILGKGAFDNPKPSTLIVRALRLTTGPHDIILDSFAGSGTTAQAVLALNKEDGGNRKFILVEVEGYADKITAERVRRVISGVPTTSDETLHEGLGGSFTFCELGQPISIDGLLKGTALPDYATLASYVFYTATGATLAKPPKKPASDFLIGEHNGQRIHLIYKPDKKFLRSNEAMLNSDRAETIATSTPAGSRALVFAAGKFMSQNELAAQRIEFSQLPYTLHRVFGN
jgi:adenine-specific DNA-methyltransferase